MDAGFWHERWSRGEIGFHQSEVNPQLRACFERLQLPPGAHVFVPLCGKSLDVAWLLAQGFRVTGVEISRRAVEDFFTENGLAYTVTAGVKSQRFDAEGLTIHCADFFAFDGGDMPPVDGVYDRASLVALPPDMRPGYAEKLTALMPAGARSLLLTLEYDQAEMAGPPFAVSPSEVRSLFAGAFRIEPLARDDCLEREPRFREKGLTRLIEHTFLLERLKEPGD